MKRMVLAWVGLFFFGSALGYAQMTTGTISGVVTDASGAVLPGAKLTFLNEETGVTRTSAADASGRYSAPSLSLGHYKVTVAMDGFQTAVRTGIELTVGRQAVLDFQLQVGSVTQTVEVTGEAPLVETTQSSVSALVDSNTINQLPLNGRNLSDLVLLQTGVSKLENAAVATHRGYGTQISISGARSDDNIFLLDGTDIADYQNNAPVGPNGIMYGAGSVREFQVQTSNLAAQYGRTMGGVFNSVSKSGTNTLNGELFESLRNSDTDARNFFDRQAVPTDPRLPPLRRNQFGGGVGGPVVHDKTFFHFSYEGLRSSKSTTARPKVPGALLKQGILPDGTSVAIQPTAASIIPYYPAPTPGGQSFSDGTAEYIVATPTTVSSNYFQTRMDHQLSDKDSIFGRFTFLKLSQEVVSSTPGYLTDTDNGSRFFTLSHTRVISARDLNTFQVAFNRNTLTEEKITPDLPALKYFADSPWPGNFSVTGIGLGFSIALWPNFNATTNRYEAMDDFTMTRGDHSFKFGGNFQRMQANQNFPNIPNGQYSFKSWQAFLTYTPGNTTALGAFRGTPPSGTDSVRGFRLWYLSGYAQDDWKIRPNLTLNVGVRYDFGSVPTEVNGKISNFRTTVPGGDFAATGQYVIGDPLWQNPTTKNFAPRLGFAWQPFKNGKTSIRGGTGLFYGRLDVRQYWGNRDGFIAKGYAVAVPSHFPDAALEISASGGTVQVFDTAYDIKAPHDWQWTLNIQQQLSDTTVLAVGYSGNRGINLASIANFNAPETTFVNGELTAPLAPAAPLTGRRNEKLETMDLTGSQADSWYEGMTVDLKRRLTAGLQFQFAYTWSKAMSTADQTSRAQLSSNRVSGYFLDPAHIDADKSLSPWDARHVVKINSVYELPFGPRKAFLNHGGVASYIVGGWQLGGVTTLKTGSPFTYEVAVPGARSGYSLSNMTFQEVRPDILPGRTTENMTTGTTAGCTFVSGIPGPYSATAPAANSIAPGQQLGTPWLYYDPCAFSWPAPGTLGNVGRLTGVAPGIVTVDLSLQKSFPITERVGLQFRAETFNITNRANFGIPARSLFNATGGMGSNIVQSQINDTTVDSRSMQFDLKLTF